LNSAAIIQERMTFDQPIAFVTCERQSYIHDDDRLVAEELRNGGLVVTAAVWTDPAVDWTHFAAVVLRATWDYHLQPARYAAWLRDCASAGVNLWNPAAAVLANLDKRYLARLAATGIETVPFAYVERGQPPSLRDLLEGRGWAQAVIKPAVSASAFGTWRTSLADSARHQERFAQELTARSLMVQPFADEIVTTGEWSIVFFDGEYSHAVLKQPASGDFRVQEELGGHAVPRQPSPALIEDARRVLSGVAGPLLYARVDGIERDGRFVLMELEINEPFLYVGSASGAAERFAQAIVQRVGEHDGEDPNVSDFNNEATRKTEETEKTN
jgi:glutathione synthase/RimK-type ligase-like ATP-grasp enzyme